MFDQYGNFNGSIPSDCVRDCTTPGQDASSAVQYWVDKLRFVVPPKLARDYLHDFGAWDDLADVDAPTLSGRVLWVACGALMESGEWSGVMR